MVITDKKQVLLDIVEDADEKLTGLLIALANEYNTTNEEYSSEEIQGFYKIRDAMLAHPETGRSPKETHNLIRNKKK